VCALLSCEDENTNKQGENIVQISYRHFGGWLGISENLTITADSIHYSYGSYYPNDEEKEIHEAISKELWENLVNKCDLEIFAKIRSGESQLPVDGTDQKFTIKTKERELSVLNVFVGESEQLYEFFDLIVEQVSLFREK
jgi:Fe-S cluster biosynthesis and repair protein YggX